MRTTLFSSVVDVADAGAETVLDDMLERARVDGVTVSASYHAARDLLPHARGSRLRRLDPGLWINRDPSVWRGCPVEPRRAGDDQTEVAVAALIDGAERRGASVDGWAVFMHVDGDNEVGVQRNAFGDPLTDQLCPANPAARVYAMALARAILRAGMRDVLAESLHHHGLEHGVHHERYLFELGGVARFLLGLCLCEHCVAGATAAGGDGPALRRTVAATIQQALDTGRPLAGDVATRADAATLFGGELAALLDARETAVTSLIAEVAATCREEGGGLTVLDSSGAAKGYADGRPEGAPAVEMSWIFGLDPARISEHCAVEAIAYAHDPARVGVDLDAYRAAIGERELAAVVRPFGADCDSEDNLRAKVALARAAGCTRLDFYHYGLMPLPILDRIAASMA